MVGWQRRLMAKIYRADSMKCAKSCFVVVVTFAIKRKSALCAPCPAYWQRQ